MCDGNYNFPKCPRLPLFQEWMARLYETLRNSRSRVSGKDSEMSSEGEPVRDVERKRMEEHSRRITKWLLDGRLASERMPLPKDKGTAEREAA